MFASRKTSTAKPAPVPAEQSAFDLEALSRQTDGPIDVLRTFAGISEPANELMFSAESGRKAFAGVKVRGTHA